MIDDVQTDVLKTIVDSLRQVWTHRESPDLEFVKENHWSFVKSSDEKSIKQSVDLLKQQNYDEIKSMIDETANTWCWKGYRTWIHYIEERLSKQTE